MSIRLLLSAILTIFICMILILNPLPLNAQRLPVPETVGRDQMVSFSATADFGYVIQILSNMAMKFENKMIIDPTNQTGMINVEIPPMYWLKALEIIVNEFGLEYADKGRYIEIIRSEQATADQIVTTAAPARQLKDGDITKFTRDIEISAIFFQGDQRDLAESGIDWSVLADFGNLNIFSLGGSSVSQQFFSVASNFTDNKNNITLSGLFNTFEAMNLGEVIARPTIMVMDGTAGIINVGQSYSIKQKDFAGNTTDKFFDVGTILQVTPKVIEDEGLTFIHLKIHAERSSAAPDPVSTRIDKQVATTDVLLVNGEQTYIAGLYADEKVVVRKGIPVLKDLPWWVLGLRYLTGFNSEDRIKKELIIVIKAELMPTLEERMKMKALNLEEALEKQEISLPDRKKK